MERNCYGKRHPEKAPAGLRTIRAVLATDRPLLLTVIVRTRAVAAKRQPLGKRREGRDFQYRRVDGDAQNGAFTHGGNGESTRS